MATTITIVNYGTTFPQIYADAFTDSAATKTDITNRLRTTDETYILDSDEENLPPREIQLVKTLFKNEFKEIKELYTHRNHNSCIVKATSETGKEYVIKALVLPTCLYPDERKYKLTRFRREIEITDGLGMLLRREGVVKVICSGIKYPGKNPILKEEVERKKLPEAVPYFITEYIAGGDLERICCFGIEQQARVLKEIAQTIAFVHRHYYIVHKDLKPANIMLTKENKPVLIDFETAEAMGAKDRHYEAGTIPYFSPTQAQGMLAMKQGKDLPVHTYRTDMYSFGLVIAETMFGRKPENPIDLLREHFKECENDYYEFIASDPDLKLRKIGIQEIDDIIHRCLAKDNDKFKSMQDVADALAAFERKL